MARPKLPQDVIDERIERGARFREERERHGISQDKLSELSGVTSAKIEKIENGATAVTVEELDRICKAFGALHRATVREWIMGRETSVAA